MVPALQPGRALGGGQPAQPGGLKTDYLWREVLGRGSLTDILENYDQLLAEKDTKTGRKKRMQIWPRYQQLEVVSRLLADEFAAGFAWPEVVGSAEAEPQSLTLEKFLTYGVQT